MNVKKWNRILSYVLVALVSITATASVMLGIGVMDRKEQSKLDALEERLIDAGSALSGCGPAFVSLFIEALADGAVACGLPRDKAMVYAAATMEGSAKMFLSSGQHPGALKDAVCSPMGSTICGLRALEEHSFRAAAMDCVIATYNRNKEMGK